MTGPSESEARQREYYARTASRYDAQRASEDAAHEEVMSHVLGLVATLGAKSALDVGAGTGRTVRRLLDAPMLGRVAGIEPVPELIAQAEERGIPAGIIQTGDGRSLPFEDASFDVVIETGVLHHVKEPRLVVREMLRVARRAVFISDSNRFGQGRLAARLVKLGLFGAGLWPVANWVKTRGKGHWESEGDGISYSYSVFDDLPELAAWADRLYTVPTGQRTPTPAGLAAWTGPLLSSPQLLVCALRDG